MDRCTASFRCTVPPKGRGSARSWSNTAPAAPGRASTAWTEPSACCSICSPCKCYTSIAGGPCTYSADSPLSESQVIAPIFEKNVLVLDELGAKRTSPWVEETIFYIINHRYNNKKMTIFTSNYLDDGEDEEDPRDSRFKRSEINPVGEETLVDRIGKRLRSRIYEMCKIVNIIGKDFRKEIKQGSFRF